MAGNTVVLKTADETVKLWASSLFKEAGKMFFFKNWVSEKENTIIQMKNDLTKEAGDQITITLVMDLSDAGQSSQTYTTLEGNEEPLAMYSLKVEVTEYSHAIRSDGKLTMRRTAYDMKKTMKGGLAKWLKNKWEDLLVTKLSTSPTSGRQINCTSGLPSSGVVMSTALISQAKRKAQLSSPKVAPLIVDGQEWYFLLIHPYQSKALSVEDAWIKAQREIGPRDKTNPIFSGMKGYWDGVIVQEYDRIILSSPNEARALLLGQQAAVIANAQQPMWYEKDFDYNRYPGIATDFISGIYKTVFNSQDFGVVTLDTKYVAD